MTTNNTLPPPKGKHFEIVCNHVVYNRTSFRTFLPKDSVYIGIIREPYAFFVSSINYMRPGYIFNRIKVPAPGSTFLKDPSKYEPALASRSFTNNRMAFEFGCPEEVIKSKDPQGISKFIEDVDSDFKLVIISEMFQESIMLMKRLLKWSVKDVLYLDKNISARKNSTHLVGPYDRQIYKRWATIDYALYDHFYKRLRDQIRREGQDFDNELLHYGELRKMTSEFCSVSAKNKDAVLEVNSSVWDDAFNVTRQDCQQMMSNEIPFVQEIRLRQYGSKDI